MVKEEENGKGYDHCARTSKIVFAHIFVKSGPIYIKPIPQ